MEECTQWVGLLRDDPPQKLTGKHRTLHLLQPQEPTLGLQAEQRLEVQGDEGRDGPSTANNLAAHQKGIKTGTQTDTPMQACLRESRAPVKRMTLTAEQVRHLVQFCPTLCDPMDFSTPGLPVPHQFPEFTQTHVH